MNFCGGRLITIITSCSIFLMMGCDNKKGSNRYDTTLSRNFPPIDSLTLEFVVSDTVIIKDFLIGDYSDYQTINTDHESILIGLNQRDHAIDFINLSKKVSEGQMVFQREGRNGISGNIDGFFFHNQDTIFILSIDENRIYIMNDKGIKIDHFDFNQIPLPDGFDNYDVYADVGIQNGPYFNALDKTLQFYTYRWVNSNDDDFSYDTFASFSIADRSFKSTYGIYPAVYQKGSNFVFYNDPGLLVVDSLSYVYFGVSERIFCYNNNSGELIYVSAHHCEHWKGSPSPISPNADYQQGQDWLISQPAFVFLLYNEFDNLFYRFLKHGQPITNSAGLLNPIWTGEWCIELFDHEMRPVGHTELPANQVFPIISFISSGTLWIKNPSNQAKENESFYYQLKLNETER